MIVIAGFIIGALWGGLTAKRRGGKVADVAQYAIAFALAFALLGLLVTIVIERLA
ncbi:apolipoprotein acyltransferase [Actibacterium sp.]|uniref:apolipoprotein acyltransferase n=1 Tax=Actibacterium sp. TaxID=1872125 RepID=UPI00356536B2